jgi:hypothetical protein
MGMNQEIRREKMKLAIVKWIVKKWLPGWKLIEPGYHRHKNPEQKKKVKDE